MGPIENRTCLLLAATDAAILVWGADRVGIHLAPRGDFDPLAAFVYGAEQLGQRGIALIFRHEL